MKDEFKIDLKSFIKKQYKLLILVNIIAVIVIAFLSGLKFKPTNEETVFIFMSDNLTLTSETTTRLYDISKDYGIRQLNALGYDQDDQYFFQTFSTRGYFGSDLFILSKDVVNLLMDSKAFMTIDPSITTISNLYIYDEENNIVAIGITDEYYVLVNKRREKPNEMINKMLVYLLQNGGDIFEKAEISE